MLKEFLFHHLSKPKAEKENDHYEVAMDDVAGSPPHVAMIPWLAFGHLIPYLNLAFRLSQAGLKVSFISTPRNIQNLIASSSIHQLINFVSIPLLPTPGLPENAESTMDVPADQSGALRNAFNALVDPITEFLSDAQPDWIFYDFAAWWVAPVAAKIAARSVFFSPFTVSNLCFSGSPTSTSFEKDCTPHPMTPEDLTIVPSWIPFESNMAYRLHEAKKLLKNSISRELVRTDVGSAKASFGAIVSAGDVIAVRSGREFESSWIDLLQDIHNKPVLPVGYLFPRPSEEDGDNKKEVIKGEDDEKHVMKWLEIKSWLDRQTPESVLYVNLGSEVTLDEEELKELAIGLEMSNTSFLWVIRNPPGGSEEDQDSTKKMLPDGFADRVKNNGRGTIYVGWVPQVKILSHPSTGGYLTHSGWGSIIEAIGFGRVPILLPMVHDQGLVARLVGGMKLGLEIPRNDDGSFTSSSVADSIRNCMANDCQGEHQVIRANVSKMKEVIVSDQVDNGYLQKIIDYLKENKCN